MFDLEVSCPAFEEGHDRVRDSLQDRFVALAIRLNEVLPDGYPWEIRLALQPGPSFVGPGDHPIGVEDRDRATLQVKIVLDHISVRHPRSVRSPANEGDHTKVAGPPWPLRQSVPDRSND